VLENLEVGGTVDEAFKGGLEEVRDTLREILNQAGGKATEEKDGAHEGPCQRRLPKPGKASVPRARPRRGT